MKRLSLFPAIGLLMGMLFQSTDASAQQWIDSAISTQTAYNCVTGQTDPYVKSYVGYYGKTDGTAPLVGDVYWGHVVFGVPAACLGYALVATDVVLPPNTQFAVDATNKISCWYYPASGGSAVDVTSDPAANCPAAPTTPTSAGSGLLSRKVAQGATFEIVFPLKSSAVLNGSATSTDKMTGYFTSDASATAVTAEKWVWVFSHAPSITYTNPSTTNITDTAGRTTGWVYNHYSAGNAYFDLGTTTSYGSTSSAIAVANTYDGASLSADWNSLTAGTTYHWRLRFVDSAGVVYNGADQSFATTGSTPPVTHTLTLSAQPGGSTAASPGGGVYNDGTVVTLTATPDTGYSFSGWNIDNGTLLSVNNPETVTMTANHTVFAAFTPPPPLVLTTVIPSSGGSITASPSAPSYTAGTVVSLTATPAAGYFFTGWVVDSTSYGTTNPLSLTMNANHTVRANFSLTLSLDATANKGDVKVPMLQFTVPSMTGTGARAFTIDSITLKADGAGNDALDVVKVSLYEDANGNGLVDGGEALLGTGTYSKDDGSLNLTLASPYSVPINSGSYKFLVTYDFNTILAGSLFAPFSVAFVGMLAFRKGRNRLFMALLTAGLVTAVSCGGGGGGGTPAPATPGGGGSTEASLVSLAVTPATPTLTTGSTQQFIATGTYSDATTKDLTASTVWNSSSTGVASVSSGGLASALSAGTTIISAVSGTISGNTTLTVTAAPGGGGGSAGSLVSIAVAPASPTLTTGSTQQFVATGTYSDTTTKDLTASVTWNSGSTGVASVSSGGLASALSAGTSIISAVSGTVSGNTTLTVTAAPGGGGGGTASLVSIAVAPASPTLTIGSTQQFAATGTYSDTTTKDLTASVTWTSGSTGVASVSSGGLASALSAGTSIISAVSGTVSGSATVTVSAPALSYLVLAPVNLTITTGSTQQFTATGHYSDSTTKDVTGTVVWSTSDPAVATISAAGLASALAAGQTTISATSGNSTVSSTLYVIPGASGGGVPAAGTRTYQVTLTGGKVTPTGLPQTTITINDTTHIVTHTVSVVE